MLIAMVWALDTPILCGPKVRLPGLMLTAVPFLPIVRMLSGLAGSLLTTVRIP